MEIAWNQVTQQVLYTQITRQIYTQNFIQTQSQACIILKARGEEIMLFSLLIPYISLYASKRNSLGLKHCVRALCIRVFLCARVHACVCLCLCTYAHRTVCIRAHWRLRACINKETALVAYNQAWSTAKEIILCSGISASELTVHHLDFAVYPRKGCNA